MEKYEINVLFMSFFKPLRNYWYNTQTGLSMSMNIPIVKLQVHLFSSYFSEFLFIYFPNLPLVTLMDKKADTNREFNQNLEFKNFRWNYNKIHLEFLKNSSGISIWNFNKKMVIPKSKMELR